MVKRRQVLRATGATAVLGCGMLAPAWAQKRSIVVGQSAALTGPAKELGLQFKLGAEICFDAVNSGGGVQGHSIELRSVDDGFDPARCVENTRSLIESGVDALFGYVGTAPSLAALPIATAAKTVFFAPFTGSEALRIPFNTHAFHVRASYVDETKAIVKHLTSVGIQRIGVFYQNDGDGKSGLLGVARALKLQYQSPSGIGSVNRNSVEVTAAVQSVLSGKPDAIVLVSTYQSCAAFIRAARSAGFGGVFYAISFVGTQALARVLGADARGVVVSQVVPYPFAPTTRLAGDYLAAGRHKLGQDFAPSYGSIEGYLAARIFVEGVRRATGGLNANALIAAFESLREADVGGFRIDFGREKHVASKFIDLTILTDDGRTRR